LQEQVQFIGRSAETHFLGYLVVYLSAVTDVELSAMMTLYFDILIIGGVVWHVRHSKTTAIYCILDEASNTIDIMP
jgi:hypothetical protein